MNTTTLRWLLVVLALVGYWFTAFETAGTASFTISKIKLVAEAQANGNDAAVETLAKQVELRLRNMNDAVVSTFYGFHAAISAVLAALLAIEVVQPPTGPRPAWRLTAFADNKWLAWGIVLLFISWVVVSASMCLQAFTASDDFGKVLAGLSKVIPDAERDVAMKLKGIWEGVRTATMGTLVGALYAAFAVKPRG
jgi:hypothetical protein